MLLTPLCDFGTGVVGGCWANYGGYGSFTSIGGTTCDFLAVRPVVSLRSGATVEDIAVVSESEEDWIIIDM